jgi:hypothetical protein
VGIAYRVQLSANGGVPFPSQGQGTYYDWFLIRGPLPRGFSLNPLTGQISGTDTTPGAASYTFTVEVEDSYYETASASFTIDVVVLPAVATQGLPPAPAGTTYSVQLQANNGVPPYSWSLAPGSTLPAWLQLSSSGQLSGKPGDSDVGTTSFAVKVTDSLGGTAAQTLSVKVTAAGLQVTTPTSLPAATVGQHYDEPLSATGGYPPYDWYVVSSLLPNWLQLTYSNGYALTGTPPQSDAGQSYTFELEVQDSTGAPSAITKTFALSVTAPGLSITTASLPKATESQFYSYDLAATGGNGSYTWSVQGGQSLPGWLSLSPGGVLSGTPPASVAGTTATVPVEVQDSETSPQQATATLSLAVLGAPPTITTTSPLTDGTAAEPYSFRFQASGGTAPLSWCLYSIETLTCLSPSTSLGGLTLSANGTLSGTILSTTGGHTLTLHVMVTDADGNEAHGVFYLPVLDGLAVSAGSHPSRRPRALLLPGPSPPSPIRLVPSPPRTFPPRSIGGTVRARPAT